MLACFMFGYAVDSLAIRFKANCKFNANAKSWFDKYESTVSAEHIRPNKKPNLVIM